MKKKVSIGIGLLLVLLISVVYINTRKNTVFVGEYDDDIAYSEKQVDGEPEIQKEDLGNVNLLVGQQYPLKRGTYTWESRESDGGTCGAYYINNSNKEHNENNRIKVSGEIKVTDDNSYVDMTDSTPGGSGRCSSQKIVNVSYESSEKTTQKVWASYGKTYSGKEICSLNYEDVPCDKFEYYDELKSKLKQSDVDALQPLTKTAKGVESGSDFVELREKTLLGNTICYQGVSNTYATEKQKDESSLTFDLGTSGNYYGKEVNCSNLLLSEDEMYDIGIKF